MRKSLLSLTVSALALVAAAITTGVQAQEEVGNTAAVNPDATGTPPGAPMRTLELGDAIIFNERITTSNRGNIQILFADQTTLTLGPNSDLTVDQFVYNPGAAGEGSLLLSLSRGSMRIFGGELGEAGRLDVNTPSALLGIRGTSAVIDVDEGSGASVFVCLVPTCVALDGEGNTIGQIDRAGYMMVIGPDGVTDPFPASAEMLSQYNQQFESEGEETGGTDNPPSEGDVALGEDEEGMTYLVLPFVDQWVDPSGWYRPDFPFEDFEFDFDDDVVLTLLQGHTGSFINSPPTQILAVFRGDDDQVRFILEDGRVFTLPFDDGFEGFFSSQTAGGFGLVDEESEFYFFEVGDTPNPQPGDFGIDTAADFFLFGGLPFDVEEAPDLPALMTYDILENPFDPDSNNPLLPSSASGAFLQNASPLYSIARTGEDSRDLLAVALGINDTGDGQQISFAGLLGEHRIDPEFGESSTLRLVSFGQQSGSDPFSAGGDIGLIPANGGIFDSDDEDFTGDGDPNWSPVFYGGDSPDFGVIGPQDFGTQHDGEPPFPTVSQLGGAATPYEPYAPVLINTAGGADTAGLSFTETRTLHGYAVGAGTMYLGGSVPLNGGGGGSYATTWSTLNADPFSVEIAFYGEENRAGAVFNVETSYDQYAESTESSGSNEATFYFGQHGEDPSAYGAQRYAIVNDTTYAMQESALNDDFIGVDDVTPFNDSTGIVNDSTVSQDYGILASSTLVPVSGNVVTDGLCDCQYLQWGWWGYRATESDSETGDVVREDLIPLGTYVVGDLPSPGDFTHIDGTATYAGGVIANIVNDGSQYVATGSFNNSYNFGTRSGSMAINNLDSRDYSGAISSVSDIHNYSGTLTGDHGVTAAINGSFFTTGADTFSNYLDAVAATGGQVILSGDSYNGVGTFAGSRTGYTEPPEPPGE